MRLVVAPALALLVIASALGDEASSTKKCLWAVDCEDIGCEQGSYCKVMGEAGFSISQCFELSNFEDHPACYPTSNGRNDLEIPRRGCLSDSDCCNPAATCVYSLCHLACTREHQTYQNKMMPHEEDDSSLLSLGRNNRQDIQELT